MNLDGPDMGKGLSPARLFFAQIYILHNIGDDI